MTNLHKQFNAKIPEKHRASVGRVKMWMTLVSIAIIFLLPLFTIHAIFTSLSLSILITRIIYSIAFVTFFFTALTVFLTMLFTAFENDEKENLKWFYMTEREIVKEYKELFSDLFSCIWEDRSVLPLPLLCSFITMFLMSFAGDSIIMGISIALNWLYNHFPCDILYLVIFFLLVLLVMGIMVVTTGYIFMKTYVWADEHRA